MRNCENSLIYFTYEEDVILAGVSALSFMQHTDSAKVLLRLRFLLLGWSTRMDNHRRVALSQQTGNISARHNLCH